MVYSVSDTAADLVANSGAALNEAVALTATGTATVSCKRWIIEAATNNKRTTTYNITDTAVALGGAAPAVLSGATLIDASDDNVTLTDAQVTGIIISKFHTSDHLTLNAEFGIDPLKPISGDADRCAGAGSQCHRQCGDPDRCAGDKGARVAEVVGI